MFNDFRSAFDASFTRDVPTVSPCSFKILITTIHTVLPKCIMILSENHLSPVASTKGVVVSGRGTKTGVWIVGIEDIAGEKMDQQK